jgi:hypothetical protein
MTVAALASLAAAGTVHAAVLGPTKASQLVRLQAVLNTSPFCSNFGVQFDKQLLADGTQIPFSGIPAGQVLLVTDVFFGMSGVLPNEVVVGTVEAETASSFAPIISASGEGDASGTVGAVATLASGGAAKSGTTLCFASNSNAVTTQSAVINGYLTRDR